MSEMKTMAMYKRFAMVYRMGWYTNFSLSIAEDFPELLEYIKFKPSSILDLACGEGSFAIEMAKSGLDVIGVDISSRMLSLAKEKSKSARVKVEWIRQDMITLALQRKVDLCTCWFDSLNYILAYPDLKQVFKNIFQVLNPDGFFIFDMNTRYGLIEKWNRFPCYVPQDTKNCFEVHQPSFDYEKNIASMKITGFVKEDSTWKRIQEIHKEKAYSIQEIREAFTEVGFYEIHCFGDLMEHSPLDEQSDRVFFILRN